MTPHLVEILVLCIFVVIALLCGFVAGVVYAVGHFLALRFRTETCFGQFPTSWAKPGERSI